jgi:hypothetical protein
MNIGLRSEVGMTERRRRGRDRRSLVDAMHHLDDIVAELQRIPSRPGLARTLAVGGVVFHRFFGGDAQVWHDRRRDKGCSVRLLARTKGCPFSKSALCEAVSVYFALSEVPSVQRFGHVRTGHVVTVLALEAEARRYMLEIAERERLSVRALRQRVAARRASIGQRMARNPASMKRSSNSS